ncbi:hypothetical protein BH10BDE1_BH10BDE1_09390 [soil metagenome]
MSSTQLIAQKKHRYRQSGGKSLIEIRIKTAQQLFDARDPAPFRERDLDDDFVDYIVSAAREAKRKTPLKILIYIEEAESADLPRQSIQEAITTFFAYQTDRQHNDLKSFMRRAQVFLVIGLGILATCLGLVQNFFKPGEYGALGILREGLVIFGWVSIWKPLELILYDWYPLYEKLRFNRKLLRSEIEIKFDAK